MKTILLKAKILSFHFYYMERKLKNKRVWNKVVKIQQDLYNINRNDLQFQTQDHDTRQGIYTAIDSIKVFLDNVA